MTPLRIRSVLALVLLGVACAGPGAGMTAYVGAELFDGTGAPVVHDAVVIIVGGRIEAAGPPDRGKVPRGADVTNTAGSCGSSRGGCGTAPTSYERHDSRHTYPPPHARAIFI